MCFYQPPIKWTKGSTPFKELLVLKFGGSSPAISNGPREAAYPCTNSRGPPLSNGTTSTGKEGF